jgi:hypothetical protein
MADRAAPPGDDGEGDPGDGEAAPADPRLWFLREPGALATRLVLAETLGEPRGRAHGPGHAPPTGKRR